VAGCTITKRVTELEAHGTGELPVELIGIVSGAPCASQIEQWMYHLQHMVKRRIGNDPRRLFNYDETGFGSDKAARTWVMMSLAEYRTYRRAECKAPKSPYSQHLSAAVCISAAGKIIPTLYITCGKTCQSLLKFGRGPKASYMSATSKPVDGRFRSS
jgi:hypothetical protein